MTKSKKKTKKIEKKDIKKKFLKEQGNNQKKIKKQQTRGGGIGREREREEKKGKKGNSRSLQTQQRPTNSSKLSRSPHPPHPTPSSSPSSSVVEISSNSSSSSSSHLSVLQQKFQKKLEGARFRTINERLYTCRGEDAFEEFQRNNSLFQLYHEGYREQVKSWPQNPLDTIISWIKGKYRNAVVADMGCGEARLAASIPNITHSFDLVSHNSSVVACDIAHVPLDDQSVDIVVFCLSLMGTNVSDFLKEAHRILRVGGLIKIAEVRSRFEGNESNSLQTFLKTLKKLGFHVTNRDMNNTMFFMVEGVKKESKSSADIEELVIQPCLYKRR